MLYKLALQLASQLVTIELAKSLLYIPIFSSQNPLLIPRPLFGAGLVFFSLYYCVSLIDNVLFRLHTF